MNDEISQVENVVNDKEKGIKKKYRRFIIVLVILLLVSWMFIVEYGISSFKSKKDKENADIFEIQCGVNCDCDSDGPIHNINPPSEDGTDEDDSSDDEEDLPVDSPTEDDNKDDDSADNDDEVENPEENVEINVSDNDIKWQNSSIYQTTNKLNIFENPDYNNEHIIAPLSSNTYKFIVKNATKYVVDYKLIFGEENKHAINMKYRLRKNGYYVVGNEEEWVTYDKLSLEFDNVSRGNVDNYELDWKWFESDNDTLIGAIGTDYTLKISVTAVDSSYE